MRRLSPLVALACLSCKSDPVDTAADAGENWVAVTALEGGAGRALAALDGAYLAAGEGLFRSEDGATWAALAPEGLPEGEVIFLGALGGSSALAYVNGAGLYRSADAGDSWAAVSAPPSQPLMATLNPRARVVPFDLAVDEAGTAWLAGVGGLFRSDDDGDTWSGVDLSATEHFNVLFTGVAARDGQVWATAQLADSILPSDYAGLLSGTIFASPDGGESWVELGEDYPGLAPMGAAIRDDGAACIAAMDAGVRCFEAGRWVDLGGPPDAAGIARLSDGALGVASAWDGVWLYRGGGWTRTSDRSLVRVVPDLALDADGGVYALDEIDAVGAGPAGGEVYVALSFHVNLYHSYRGDSPTDDGYGLDIDVIRTVLDWLDEHPRARADWDIENHFSLDGWLASDAPDVIERIQARVASGKDDVRVMSWNNGAMASSTEAEFRESVRRAQDSYDAVFESRTRGVQPQECMFTPDHIGWYLDEGIDWITLFYSATGFTALREDLDLRGRDLYRPSLLTDPQTGEQITWVPVYHHGDVLDHGGLAGWVQQISARENRSNLLVIHFDADAASWENFGTELEALEPLIDAGIARYANIEGFLDNTTPAEGYEFVGDVADGTGDGFQSWAEKDFNHEIFTEIVRARTAAAQAELLGGADAGVAALIEDAMTPRLIALSTTHFGLAAPYLHDDRIAAAREYAAQAVDAANAALDAALALDPAGPGEIRLHNARPSSGPALVEIPLEIPASQWTGADAVALYTAGGEEIPAEIEVIDDTGDAVLVELTAVVDVDAASSRTLTWGLAPGPRATGGIGVDDVAGAELPLQPAFTECDGQRADAEYGPADVVAGDRGVRARSYESADLALCDGQGDLRLEVSAYDGLPGAVVAVAATMGVASDPDDAESVALSPIACEGLAETVTWQTFGGTVRERPARPGVESWNGQSVDGWMALGCADGTSIQIAHRVPERTSVALAPLRSRDGYTLAAPLGTLWGATPWHDGRATGGSGVGEVVVEMVGSQFRPAAPDWSGAEISYRLLVGSGVEEDVLDLFAHPPLVEVGPTSLE